MIVMTTSEWDLYSNKWNHSLEQRLLMDRGSFPNNMSLDVECLLKESGILEKDKLESEIGLPILQRDG